MKLVILYGPPGVGKLTVAKILRAQTGFRLLDNHLISDLCGAVFDFGDPARTELNMHLRHEVYRAAALHNVSGVISTAMCYVGPLKDITHRFYEGCADLARETGGELCLTHLTCAQNVLEHRVCDPSRLGTKKIVEVEKLRRILREELPDGTVPPRIAPSFHLDTTHLDPSEAARRIFMHYAL